MATDGKAFEGHFERICNETGFNIVRFYDVTNGYKKIGKALLFPHIAIMIILVPISIVFLVYSMVFLGTESITAIISYVLAFYTLAVWCAKI